MMCPVLRAPGIGGPLPLLAVKGVSELAGIEGVFEYLVAAGAHGGEQEIGIVAAGKSGGKESPEEELLQVGDGFGGARRVAIEVDDGDDEVGGFGLRGDGGTADGGDVLVEVVVADRPVVLGGGVDDFVRQFMVETDGQQRNRESLRIGGLLAHICILILFSESGPAGAPAGAAAEAAAFWARCSCRTSDFR